ncbi:MAG: AAA family ATPase [Gammaproteobacteria bacterium]|nr:AAA family ATPase [Gammaproteobacteria bacterium]
MPPHAGHEYLVRFAQQRVENLYLLYYSRSSDPLDGTLRYDWLTELFPSAHVIHTVDEDLPHYPDEHDGFWDLWRAHLHTLFPRGVDTVFASESYGAKVAAILNAEYMPVDPSRSAVPVSASAIREDPLAHWVYIPPIVRPHYVLRICLFGPESTGKSELAQRLARHYETVYVPEYARELLNPKGGRCELQDIPPIAFGQAASEDALARHANRLLFCDTDALTTTLWSHILFGTCADEVAALAEQRTFDLYLLLDVDVPWVDDTQRFLNDRRTDIFALYRQALEHRERPFVLIGGSYDERLAVSCAAVDRLLASRTPDEQSKGG